MYYYNTLDLDKLSKEEFESIYFKIDKCLNHLAVHWYDTQKGYHIRMLCTIDCDLCRLVFDDQKRYAADLGRPNCKQNVLFIPFSAHKSCSLVVAGKADYPLSNVTKPQH